MSLSLAKRFVVLFGLTISLWVAVLFACQWHLQNWWQARYDQFGQQVLQAINVDEGLLFDLSTDDLAGRMLLLDQELDAYTQFGPYRQTKVWQLASVRIQPLSWRNQAEISTTIQASDVIGRLTLVLTKQGSDPKLDNLYFEISAK